VDEVDALFSKHRENSTEFSREMVRMLNAKFHANPQVAAQVNLELAKTVFSKWSIEILTLLYSARSASYGELKRELQGITSKVLSEKLKKLESGGLARREIVAGKPPRIVYSLTEDGITVAKLGEPVFLFLGYKEGLYAPPKAVLEKARR
jgi:DNA-binding HxlR family transcriptional regulator